MSPLIIDETKIKETMEQPRTLSFVATGQISGSEFATLKLETQRGALAISGTVAMAALPNNTESRAHLVWIFKKIDESGKAIKTEKELDAEIDEMRHRNL